MLSGESETSDGSGARAGSPSTNAVPARSDKTRRGRGVHISKRPVLLLCAMLLTGCLPAPQSVDNSQKINSGVNIVPEAVLASLKVPPSSAPTSDTVPDLIDVIQTADQKHYTMIELLRNSGLVPLLQKQGPYTVLAPTDEAFDKLPPGVIDRLLLPSHHAELLAFVKYHLLDGRIGSTELLETNGQVPTLSGNKLIIRGIGNKAMINDANVLRTDSGASNGTVHWLDSVLLPPA
jgi:uncharacterized surface protein with fasciclin (FAS1) repeats